MLKIILFLICFYISVILFMYLNQRQFIYFPSHFSPTPKEAGVPEMQVVKLKTEDDLNLKAWYRPPMDAQGPTLVFFHGNAGNMGHRSIVIQPFLKAGFGVLLVTYRGYSGNPGKPNEEGLYRDARAALKFLHNRYIPEACIVLYGESIGAAVAIQMATEYHVGALILQSPFTSLKDIGQFHYSFFPIQWLIGNQFNSLKKAEQIQAPVLVLYGEKDNIVPPVFSIQLFEALTSEKQMQAIPDIGHNDLFKSDSAISFIKQHVKCAST